MYSAFTSWNRQSRRLRSLLFPPPGPPHMSRTFIGIDVSQDSLDVYVRPAGLRQRFDNTPAGIATLVAWVRPHAPERILFESTGPYQKAAVGALLAEGLPAAVVNARQVRD